MLIRCVSAAGERVALLGLLACCSTGCSWFGSSPDAASSASAGSRPAAEAPATADDRAAVRKIDAAVNDLYLGRKIEEAEREILQIINRCADCSGRVKAKGWMYVGIVRGSGSDDQDGARQAFERALHEDPGVQLDEALSTPATLKTFNATRGDD